MLIYMIIYHCCRKDYSEFWSKVLRSYSSLRFSYLQGFTLTREFCIDSQWPHISKAFSFITTSLKNKRPKRIKNGKSEIVNLLRKPIEHGRVEALEPGSLKDLSSKPQHCYQPIWKLTDDQSIEKRPRLKDIVSMSHDVVVGLMWSDAKCQGGTTVKDDKDCNVRRLRTITSEEDHSVHS